MSELVSLLGFNFEDPRSTEDWVLQHSDDHTLIRDQVQAQNSVNMVGWQLYPVNFNDWDAYELRHQSAHNEMNDALGLSGSDLRGVDFKDKKESLAWHEQHYREHLAAHSKLGV